MILGQRAVLRLPPLLRRFQSITSFRDLKSTVNFRSRNVISRQKWSPFVTLRLARSYAGVPVTSESLVGSSEEKGNSFKLETSSIEENRNLEELLNICLETRSVGEFFSTLRLISRKVVEEDVTIEEGNLAEIRRILGKIRHLSVGDEAIEGANLLSVTAFGREVNRQWPSGSSIRRTVAGDYP